MKELTLVKWLKKVAVNIILNPFFALMLFMIGIWMGSMIDPLYGLITFNVFNLLSYICILSIVIKESGAFPE
jgi:hypothetical protein